MNTEVSDKLAESQIREPAEERTLGVTGGTGTLNARASELRNQSEWVQSDVTDLHRDIRIRTLNDDTAEIAKQAPRELLDSLANEWGLSWSLIARLLGVSQTAVRKWRRGEQCSAENRRALAKLVAVLGMIQKARAPIEDPASWFEMPIADESVLSAVDLYAGGEIDLVLDLAASHMTATQALDAFNPSWRESFARDDQFEVSEGPDGLPVIIERQ